MSLLSKVLYGVGSWLVEKDKEDQALRLEQVRGDILYNRELALKQIDAGIAEKASVRDHAERLDEIAATGVQSRETAVTQAVATARADEASDVRDLQKAITIKGIDLTNGVKLEAFKHQNNLSEIGAKAVADLQTNLAEAGQTVDRIVFTKDGRGVAYSKTGKRLGETSPGVFNPSGDNSGDSLADLIKGVQPAPAASRTAAQPTPAAPGKTDKFAFYKRYNDATPQTAPGLFRNGQKIPVDEAWSLYAGQ